MRRWSSRRRLCWTERCLGAIFYEQRAEENQEKRTCLWVFIYILAFIVAFIGGIASKSIPPSWMKDYSVKWSDKVGTAHKGETFDLYTPAKKKRKPTGWLCTCTLAALQPVTRQTIRPCFNGCAPKDTWRQVLTTRCAVWFQDIVPVFLGVVFSGVCQDIVPRVMMGYGSFIA